MMKEVAALALSVVIAPTDTTALGAAAIAADPSIDWATVDTAEYITPAPLDAPLDVTELAARGCVMGDGHPFIACTEGRSDSARTVILVGDSKTFQWQPAIAPIALSTGWQLTTLSYSACPLTSSGLSLRGEPYTGCNAWQPEALAYILEANRTWSSCRADEPSPTRLVAILPSNPPLP